MSVHLVNQYLSKLEQTIHYGGTAKESAIRTAFHHLLDEYCKPKGFMLIPELDYKTTQGKTVRPDGTIKDSLRLDWGYWESKDEADDIDEEIKKKFNKGYPKDNILFEDSQTAVLYQHGNEVMRVSMKDAAALDELLNKFVSYERPEVKGFREAIEHFKQDLPTIATTLRSMIDEQAKSNKKFKTARDKFWNMCKQSINKDITHDDVYEMMIQHILTEDIFNTIFDETQFHEENNIAKELEKVLNTFFTRELRRNTLNSIQRYYQIIKASASNIADHHEKQKFLKIIYENFYKAYNPKGADRLGVVYTPNEIVKFMIESTDYLLNRHFGRFLEDKGVEILDPATGTGTFICDIIDYIRKDKLEYKYKNEIHANEVAILPYYIANLNIEYTYKQKTGKYAEFEQLCFVDTLDNMGFTRVGKNLDLFESFSEENSERIKKQNSKKISVVIGNPPYNAKQENYSNQNANRTYKEIDERIKETFIKYGTAQNQIVVYDMYTRFYRWAMDRLNDRGIICYITNNSFINSRTFDGFRKSIQDEFQYAYIIDLGGNIRELSGKDGIFLNEKHTIFGQAAAVGIAIMFLVKDKAQNKNLKDQKCQINYIHPTDIRATRDEKLAYLSEYKIHDMPFEHIAPDKKNNWINLTDNDFDDLLPLIDKDVKAGKGKKALFELFSSGLKTQRDEWVYDFDKNNLENKMKYFVEIYEKTRANPKTPEKNKIKWDRELDKYLERGIEKSFDETKIASALYRPFTKEYFYFDKHFNGQPYQWFEMFQVNQKNKFIVINSLGSSKDFHCLSAETICDLHLTGDSQCIPFYRYEDGERIENITDWGLNQFTKQYKTKKIKKEDIFYYVYAVLHNPEYRKKYELNLKREFPRVPFYEDFNQWRDWGRALMDAHIGYEAAEPYPLTITTADNPPEHIKAKLKADKEKGTIILDDVTTLSGIPPEAWEYKLGNRSALEWILDQYKEKKPSDPTIAAQFNTYRFADYKEQVIDLLRRVCTVSVETMRIVREMEGR